MSFRTFSSVDNLPQSAGEDSISPVKHSLVEFSIQVVFIDGFGVDNVTFAFDVVYLLKSFEKNCPGCRGAFSGLNKVAQFCL